MTDIYQSIIDGDYNAVQTALAQGADPDGIGKDGLHLLHYAAMANQPKIFSLLVEHGAPINAHDYHNNTPLYYICRSGGSQAFAQYAIDHGADLNAQNKIGQAPIHIAVRIGNIDALYALLKSGADVNLKDIVGKAPLHDAIATTHPNAILPLLEYGANVNQTDNHNNSPMMLGAASTNADISKWFNLPILSELPIPLHNHLFEAVISHDVQGLEKALSAGGYADAANGKGFTLLEYATLNGFVDIMNTLVSHGAEINKTDNMGIQPIHIAAMVKDGTALDAMLSFKASINATDKAGNTPLHYACQFTDAADLVKKILDVGANIDSQNNKGETPLQLAQHNGYQDVVQLLASHHADDLHDIKPTPKLEMLELSDVISGNANDIAGLPHVKANLPTQHHEQSHAIVVALDPVVILPIVEHS